MSGRSGRECPARIGGGQESRRPAGIEGRQGSALVLVVFACLATAVVLQALSTVVVCAERALADESVGRRRMAEKDAVLAILSQQALASWQPIPWTALGKGDGTGDALGEGAIEDLPESEGWVMRASVRQDPSVSRLTTSAWIERGRDGIDLPVAAVVAQTVTATPGRATPWVDAEASSGGVAGAGIHVVRPLVEPILGAGCSVAPLTAPWRLDAGWADIEGSVTGDPSGRAGGGEMTGETEDPGEPNAMSAVALGPSILWLTGRAGGQETLPTFPAGAGLAPEAPVLIVLTDGATLDARDRDDVYGVIVVDDGSVLLDGTTVHGAVFAGGSVTLGDSGQVIYSQAILRWATDRSLNRVRLVPGTREEGTR